MLKVGSNYVAWSLSFMIEKKIIEVEEKSGFDGQHFLHIFSLVYIITPDMHNFHLKKTNSPFVEVKF